VRVVTFSETRALEGSFLQHPGSSGSISTQRVAALLSSTLAEERRERLRRAFARKNRARFFLAQPTHRACRPSRVRSPPSASELRGVHLNVNWASQPNEDALRCSPREPCKARDRRNAPRPSVRSVPCARHLVEQLFDRATSTVLAAEGYERFTTRGCAVRLSLAGRRRQDPARRAPATDLPRVERCDCAREGRGTDRSESFERPSRSAANS